MKTTKVLFDWFQFSGIKLKFEFKQPFELKTTPTKTKVFNNVDELHYKNQIIADVAHNPHSSIINSNLVLVKFKNEVLYNPEFEKIFYQLLNMQAFTFNNFTRLDICTDFQTFNNNLKPENLINNFMTNKIIKSGNKKFKLIAKQLTTKQKEELKTRNNHLYSYLRFGSSTSNISAYIYNKSLELREESQKNYIMKLHEKTFKNKLLDVWRLEFSIKNFNDIILYDITGEELKFTPAFVLSEYFKVSLFNLLVNRYFNFYYPANPDLKKKPKQLILFKDLYTTFRIIFNKCDATATRTDKNFIKIFEAYNCELRNQKKELAKYGTIILKNFVEKKNLQEWYNKKFN